MIFAQDTSLNALTNVDVNRIWLPFIVYANTDQKVLLVFVIVPPTIFMVLLQESTRLGTLWEWVTTVTITRKSLMI